MLLRISLNTKLAVMDDDGAESIIRYALELSLWFVTVGEVAEPAAVTMGTAL